MVKNKLSMKRILVLFLLVCSFAAKAQIYSNAPDIRAALLRNIQGRSAAKAFYQDSLYLLLNDITYQLGAPVGKTFYINQASGVNYDSTASNVGTNTTNIQAFVNARTAGDVIVFSGKYQINDEIVMKKGLTFVFYGGSLTLEGNTADGTKAAIKMDTSCSVIGVGLPLIRHAPSGANAYRGIRVVNTFDCKIEGVAITNFGNEGILVSGGGGGTNQMKATRISNVYCYGMKNNGFGGTRGNGNGIALKSAGEYVKIENAYCIDNEGSGILNDGSANCDIIGGKFIRNDTAGVYVVGNVGNSDHFAIVGAQFNHQDSSLASFNVRIEDVDTGVNLTGCSIYGGAPLKVINSKGVSLNGCGMSGAGGGVYPHIQTSTVYINGGHIIGVSQATVLSNFTGGGTLQFNNVLDAL